jgi:hypothetical protein
MKGPAMCGFKDALDRNSLVSVVVDELFTKPSVSRCIEKEKRVYLPLIILQKMHEAILLAIEKDVNVGLGLQCVDAVTISSYQRELVPGNWERGGI